MDRVASLTRTVCHSCRVLTYELTGDVEPQKYRPLLLPGGGNLIREISPHMIVDKPCPQCGKSAEIGWIAGFVPPA